MDILKYQKGNSIEGSYGIPSTLLTYIKEYGLKYQKAAKDNDKRANEDGKLPPPKCFCLHGSQNFRGLRVEMARCSVLFAKKNQICLIRH